MSFEFTKTIVNGVKSWVKQFVEENAITKTSQLENDNEFVTSDEVDSKIAAIPTPDVSGHINTHNTATDAHNDIRLLVEGLTTRLNALANSDDTTLDQMSEIVAYIKNNKTLIEQVTTNKVNVSDIINNLTTNVTNKPLSAAQGVELKRLIDAIEIPTALKNPNTLTIDGVSYDGSEAKSIESKPLYVDVAHTGDRWTIGNTLAEIEAAYQAKRSIYLNYGSGTLAGYTLPLGLAQRFSATDWIFEGMATATLSVRVRLNNGNNTETLTDFVKESDIPTALKNPNALTINGTSYDGSNPVSISGLATEGYVDSKIDEVEIPTEATESAAGLMPATDKKRINSTIAHYYAVCETAGDVLDKVVTVDGFELVEGATVTIKFVNANSIASPTLNVNGTGAFPMRRYGSTDLSTGTTTTGWIAGALQMFTFNGEAWVRDYWNNTTYSNVSLGQGYASCSTAKDTLAKTASLSSYSLTTGGIVSVRFTNDVPANATLNINSKGAKAIYYRNAKITDGVIKAGDTATFIYSTYYRLISIDRWQSDIASMQTQISNMLDVTDVNALIDAKLAEITNAEEVAF